MTSPSSYKGAQNAAADYGCGDAFNALRDCLNSTTSCIEGQVSTDCANQKQALEACETAASVRMFN